MAKLTQEAREELAGIIARISEKVRADELNVEVGEEAEEILDGEGDVIGAFPTGRRVAVGELIVDSQTFGFEVRVEVIGDPNVIEP
jgi:hypothetical protein